MMPRIPDLIPPPPAAGPTSRPHRGGRRPGAGAPRGNLNGLKHGRHSRFREYLAADPTTLDAQSAALATARRLLARERHITERHATTLLRLALISRYQRECAAAVAAGAPLPQPPLVGLPDLDLRGLFRYISTVAERAQQERDRIAGRLTSDDDRVVTQQHWSRSIDRFIAMAAVQLDRAAGSLPSAATLAALIVPPATNQESNQSQAPLLESTAATPQSPPDSRAVQRENSMQSKPNRRSPPLPALGEGAGG